MANDLILYMSDDGASKVYLKKIDGNIWLNQEQMGELFDTTKQNISLHIQNIFADGELDKDSTVKYFLTVKNEGKRTVSRQIEHYNLDVILSVGLRVRSVKGTLFRIWATRNLKDYLIKGFLINSDQLKEINRYDYFDELLEKIRDIRASEKRFYQKVRDLFALSYDYQGNEEETAKFFAIVQNKLLYAVTGFTAADLIIKRADFDKPNMGLNSFSGNVVRKTDIYVAKNYLSSEEITRLNRLVTMFLDFAEDKADRQEKIMLDDWKKYVDSFVDFNNYPVLKNAGKIKHDDMKKEISSRYDIFDNKKKQRKALEADLQDIEELEETERVLRKKNKQEIMNNGE